MERWQHSADRARREQRHLCLTSFQLRSLRDAAASAHRFENLQHAIEHLAGQTDDNEATPYDTEPNFIYTTGSYGRGESAESSDIDLFMVDVAEPAGRLGNIDQTLLRADLIRACRTLEFPEFSGDGRYLVVHPFDNMLDALGGQQDDAANFFTAPTAFAARKQMSIQ